MSTKRNTGDTQRRTAANARKTQERVEQYQGKKALLDTWELESDEIQIANHDYLLALRARVRQIRNLLAHRADANVQI